MTLFAKNNTRKALIVGVAALIFILSSVGIIDRFIGYVGGNAVNAGNRVYVDGAFDRALNGFMVLSGLKMGLAVVKGSELEVSLVVGTQVNVGGAAQAAYDYVDVAWKTLLACMAVLIGTGYALDAAAVVDGWVLTIALFFIMLFLAVLLYLPAQKRLRRVLRDISAVAVVAAMVLYVALPLAVTGGAYLSGKITTPAVTSAEKSVSAMKNEIFPPGAFDGEGMVEKAKAAKETFERAITYVKLKSKELTGQLVRIIAGYVFDAVIFPLLLFYVFFKAVRWAVAYAVTISRAGEFKEDVAEAIAESRVNGEAAQRRE